MAGTARSEYLGVRCARTWDCRHHIAWGRRHANRRSVKRGPHRGQGPFQAMAGTLQRGRKRHRRLLAPGRPEKRMEKSDAPNARGTAWRRLWKRSFPLRKRKKRRTTAPAVKPEPRQPGRGLIVPEPGGAADWSGSGGRAIQLPRRVTEWWGPNRLGCHILERQGMKLFLVGNRAGTGIRGREMGRPSRGGSIRVTQYQPNGVRFLHGRARGLRETPGRLSVTGPRGIQRFLNGVGLPWVQRKGARRSGLGGCARPPAYEPRVDRHVCGEAGRVHSGPHVGKPSRFPPCFRMGRVPRGDPLGPPLHFGGGGG